MDFTKKQITALNNILASCPDSRRKIYIHDDTYYIANSYMAVMLPELPENLIVSDTADGKHLFDTVEAYLCRHPYYVDETSPRTEKEILPLIARHKAWCGERKLNLQQVQPTPIAEFTAQIPEPDRWQTESISSCFDLNLVLNALRAVGKNPKIYLSTKSIRGIHAMEVVGGNEEIRAMVLPRRGPVNVYVTDKSHPENFIMTGEVK